MSLENFNISSNTEQISSKSNLKKSFNTTNQKSAKSIFNNSETNNQKDENAAVLKTNTTIKTSSSPVNTNETNEVIKEALTNYKKQYGGNTNPKSREFNLYLSAAYGNSGYKDKVAASELTTISSNGVNFETRKKINGRTFEDVQNVIKKGGTPKEAAALEQEILKNGSSEEVNQYIQTALSRGGELYDENKKHDTAASDRADLINKYANSKDYVKNNICGPIHGSMVEALQEAGYEAKLISGNQVDSSNGKTAGAHYTLLYKDKNGDYVFCNYGQSMRVKGAENSEQAAKIAIRNGYVLQTSGGFLSGQKGNNNNVTGQYLHETETPYGEKHNTDNSNSNTALSKTKIDTSKKGIYVNYAKQSDINQSKITIEKNHISEDETFEAHVGLQTKTSDKTDAFYSSKGFGVNGGLQKNFKNGLSTDFDATVSYTNGQTATGSHNYIDLSGELGLGYSKNIIEKDKFSVNSAARASIQGGTGFTDLQSPGGFQARTTVEAGLEAAVKPSDNLAFNITGNAGIIGDIVPGSYDKQLPSVNPAFKLNEEVNTKINISSLSASVHGGVNYTQAFDNRYKTTEYNAGVNVKKEFDNQKSLSLGADISSETKDVKNGINERVKDEKHIKTQISYQSGSNTISANIDTNIKNAKNTNVSVSFKHSF